MLFQQAADGYKRQRRTVRSDLPCVALAFVIYEQALSPGIARGVPEESAA